jgi:hypothetical protein
MEIISLTNTLYNKNQYQKVIDTSFTQLGLAAPTSSFVAPTISVAEFFQNYQELFFSIPKFGNVDSHEYLIKTSTDYIGSNQTIDTTTQALIEEITQLRQENLSFQQQLISGSVTI